MISAGLKDVALNPSDESLLQSLRQALENSKAIPPGALDLVVKIVQQWPYSERLPGLDVLRCVARYPASAQFSDPTHGTLIDIAISSSIPNDTTPNENATMMGVRTLANLSISANGRSLLIAQAPQVFTYLERILGISGAEPIGKFNRNILIAVTTTLLNYSVLVNKEKLLTVDQRRRLVEMLGNILKGQSDSEVLYRGLVALGTVISTSKDLSAMFDVSNWLNTVAAKSLEERVEAIIGECRRVAQR